MRRSSFKPGSHLAINATRHPKRWPPTKCIFCGSADELTEEHLYSRWTRRFVPRDMRQFRRLASTSFFDKSYFSITRKPGDIRDWSVSCVCTACNNGWMRRLENRARPIMIPLIMGGRIRLLPQQQKTLAGWAAMKAMVAEYSDIEYVTTHHMHRKYLYRTQLPPTKGWAIWIAHYQRKSWLPIWLSRPFLIDDRAARRSDNRATHFNSHATTQIIGQLLIHVIRSPMHRLVGKWQFALPQGHAIFRIWPPSDFSIPWPSGTINDRSAEYIADALKEFLMRVAATERR